MRHCSLFFVMMVVILVCTLVYADVPKLINFQGRLTDSSGKFVPDGSYSITFRIYYDSTGGSAKWSEGQLVTVNKGLFNAILGSASPIPDSIFNNLYTYLGIQVGADPEMTPRQRLFSMGYAYRGAKADTSSYAMNSDKLDGFHATDFSSVGTDYGRSGVAADLYEGTNTLTSKYVNVSGPDSVYSSSGSAFKGKASGSSGVAMAGIEGYADNAANGPSFGGSFSTSPAGTGTHYGVISSGYGSTSTSAYGMNGYASNSSSGNAYGGFFSTSNSGTGEHYGLRAEGFGNSSSSTYGTYDRSENTSTGRSYGGYFETSASGSGEHYGVMGRGYGNSTSSVNIGVYGFGENLSSGGATGGYFTTSTSGTGNTMGIVADGSTNAALTAVGAWCTAHNNSSGHNAIGVNGEAYNSYGTYTVGGNFFASGGSSGNHYGVLASGGSTSSGSSYGVWSNGYNGGAGLSYGGYFRTDSAGTGIHYGARAEAYGNTSAFTYGSYGYASNSSDGSVHGGYFETSNAGTGEHYAVRTLAAGNSVSRSVGVWGQADNSGSTAYGVFGWADQYGIGDAYGVFGYVAHADNATAYGGYFTTPFSGFGERYGVLAASAGTSDSSAYGVYGSAINTSTGDVYAGYFSASYGIGTGTYHGVYAVGENASSSPAYGTYSYAKNSSTGNVYAGYFAADSAGSGGSYGIYAQATTAYWAGWFQGDLGVSHNSYVYGNSYVSGTKSAAVKVENGEYRAMYSQESPENWFEDFGEGQLTNGKTHIELDQTFLQTVTINNLHPIKVFVQLEGDCNGVFVTKGTTGFDVIELKGGTTNAAFSYRVVAKRKGYEDLRLAKIVGKTADLMALEQAKNQTEFAREKVQMEEEHKKMEQQRKEMEKTKNSKK